jgi:hypothetical protein
MAIQVAERDTELDSARAYWFAGLRLVSEFPFSGMSACDDPLTRDDEIVVRRARVPRSLPDATNTFPGGQCSLSELLLIRAGVARCLVRGGTEILVEPEPCSEDGDVRAFLLGPVFGALCHQRGLLPLHSSVIDVADGCVAFVGPKRAGKSTMVAALAKRGHRVITDDVGCLRVGGKNDLQVWPSVSRVRLWEDAVLALDYDGPGVEREKRGKRKYFVSMTPLENPTQARRLRMIYELRTVPAEGRPSLTRLHGSEVVEALMRNVYRLGLASRMGVRQAAFASCAIAANGVPVFRLNRPKVFDSLHEVLDVLEEHFGAAR